MTELQEKMAVTALDFIAKNNGVCTKNDLLKDMRLKNGNDNLARANREVVFDKLTKEIPLIRVTGDNLISLTENGEVAQRIGFDKYIKKLHSNDRLDIRLKRMDFWIKLMDLLDKSKMFIVIVFVLLYLLFMFLLWAFSLMSPTLSQAMLFLSGMALGGSLIYFLSKLRGRRRRRA